MCSDMINALVFDIDDLAYSLNEVKGTSLPNRYLVEQETYALLESLEELAIKATMFVPGYVAQRFPGLVREIDRSGHEIGSHGFKHWGGIHGCAERSLILNEKKASCLPQFCALFCLALNPTARKIKNSIRKVLHAFFIVKKSGR